MWDPSGPGINPVSQALAGGCFTTGPPRNSKIFLKELETCQTLAEQKQELAVTFGSRKADEQVVTD